MNKKLVTSVVCLAIVAAMSVATTTVAVTAFDDYKGYTKKIRRIKRMAVVDQQLNCCLYLIKKR
jgi:hypothetical protein